jgi:hypothetical protein
VNAVAFTKAKVKPAGSYCQFLDACFQGKKHAFKPKNAAFLSIFSFCIDALPWSDPAMFLELWKNTLTY